MQSYGSSARRANEAAATPIVVNGCAVIARVAPPYEKGDMSDISISLWRKFAAYYSPSDAPQQTKNIVFPKLTFHAGGEDVTCSMILHASNRVVYAEFQIETDIPLSLRPHYSYPRPTYSATTPAAVSFLLRQIQGLTSKSTGPLDELVCNVLHLYNED